jgi:hypothetical protein
MADLQAACRYPCAGVCGKLDKFKLGMGLLFMP